MSEEKGKSALILIGVPAALIASLFVVIILFLSGTGSAAAFSCCVDLPMLRHDIGQATPREQRIGGAPQPRRSVPDLA